MELINSALFLKTNIFSPNALLFSVLVAFVLAAVLLGSSISLMVNLFLLTVIFPFTTIYPSLKSHKSDLSVDVLILISLFGLYFFYD